MVKLEQKTRVLTIHHHDGDGGQWSQPLPPLGEGRVEKLVKWVKKEVSVSGSYWDSSCLDIAVAGLGWFAIGLKGQARLGIWTYDEIDIVVRNALLPQRSHIFEVTVFTISEIVSKADQARIKQHRNEKRRK
ncbi:P-loop containing nucleoside triphosphate hydrolase superfamily protein [Abeliophyllum distichum]|uniref:P-loop containing nucleoside triphosphate hydrolase superfamily protein n=1 Tax=Abeliophyllum distichum TaxID=126358 RepID=A0ABD1UST4_9LAMI